MEEPAINNQLQVLVKNLQDLALPTKLDLSGRLKAILGPRKKILGVDENVIDFVSYLFRQAGGPYAPQFDALVRIVAKVLEINHRMRILLEQSSAHAIGNMVLGGRGNLKIQIRDRYELVKVLDAWKQLGLSPLKPREVFRKMLEKSVVKEKIQEKNLLFFAKLKAVFPHLVHHILPRGFDLEQALFDYFKAQFTPIIERYEREGLTLDEMIAKENARVLLPGITRNNLLAFLVKKKHDFTCQVCKARGDTRRKRVVIHHIIALTEGGEDHSHNMLVVCDRHHQDIHEELIRVDELIRIGAGV